jgi:hypothetical protein
MPQSWGPSSSAAQSLQIRAAAVCGHALDARSLTTESHLLCRSPRIEKHGTVFHSRQIGDRLEDARRHVYEALFGNL